MTTPTLIPALQAMLQLQHQFNVRVNPEWRTAGYAWNRAIWLECAELLDGHCHWKWWKGPPAADDAQARLELVDIWHFLLSWSLTDGTDAIELLPSSDSFTAPDGGPIPPAARIEAIEALVSAAMERDLSLALHAFWVTACYFGLDFPQLHREYIAKNALNTFRNLNGYRDNTYRKVWDGREDNQHLAAIMDSGIVDFDAVMKALAESYRRFGVQ